MSNSTRPILHVKPGFCRKTYEAKRKSRWSQSPGGSAKPAYFAPIDFKRG